MSRDNDVERRTFLKYGGTTAATALSISLAGCTGDDDEDPEADDDPVDDDTDDVDDTDDTDDEDDDDEDEDEFHVTVTQGQLTDSLDPLAENATPHYNIVDQVYEPFLYRDRDGRPIERIVTDWNREDDNTIRLEIRDGVQFHSGSEMTGQDVAFSINRSNDPEISDVADPIGDIDEAVVDDGDVVVNLNAIEPTIFNNLNAFGRVFEQEWVEAQDGDLTRDMNGTGPYEFVEFEDGSHVDYERFDDYWGETPEVTSGRFTSRQEPGPRVESLLAGETDLIVNVPPVDVVDIEADDETDSQIVPSTRTIFLVMNDAFEPFDSQEFRQAMNYAVDVDTVIESQLEGFADPVGQPTLEGHVGHNSNVDPYPYDPGQAEDLVEQSGHAGTELTLHTPQGRYLNDTDVAEGLATQIDELDNVSCDTERRDWDGDLLVDLAEEPQEGSPPFFLIGWGVPTFDGDYGMAPWFIPNPVFGHFNNDELEDLLLAAIDEADPDERESILQEANELAHEQAPWVFLYQQFSIYGMSERIDWDAREDEDILFEEMSQG